EVRVLRAGPEPLFPRTCDDLDNVAGSVAAHVTIPERGRYRFALLFLSTPNEIGRISAAPTLHLVPDCTRPVSYLACSETIDRDAGTAASIDVDLDPGRYSLVTGSWLLGSVGDVAMRWTRASEWGDPHAPAPADE